MDSFPTPEADSHPADDVFNVTLGKIRDLDRRSEASRTELRNGVNTISAGLLVGLMMLGAWVFYGAPAYERMALINQESSIAWNR